MSATSRKKRVSKKLKSSWRKHVNISDVEEFLEDKRLEERLGPPLATLTNDELFKVDTQPSLELLSSKERHKLRAAKPLKCFSALLPHTNVPDPITKRNRVRTKEERKNILVKLKELHNRENGILKAKEKMAMKNRKLDDERRKNVFKKGEFKKDLWDECDAPSKEKENGQWLTTNTKKHNLRGGGIPVKDPKKAFRKKTSILPAVQLPHPGMSYNPGFQDHQDLLTIVAEKESQLIKEDQHLTRCTSGMFQKVTADKRDSTWMIEMSEGLPSKNGTNVEENEDSDNEYKSINPPVENKKKSLKQRRKQKEQLELEKARNAVKMEKKKITDIHKIKILKENIGKLEKHHKISQERKKKKLEQTRNKTKMLGSLKFEEPDIEFNMAQEISGNLKNLKTEGNLLVDRFKSMQRRNILVPTKRQIRKKPKVKKFVKPGHRDEDWKKTIARKQA